MKKIIAVCLTFAMLCSFAACGQSADRRQIEGEGFDTPEEAVTAYLEAMKAGDVEGMISTFAVETYVDHYDLAEHINQWTAYIDRQALLAPIDDCSRALNIGRRTSSIYDELTEQYLILTNGDYYEQSLNDDIEIGEADSKFSTGEHLLVSLTDPEWLRNLEKLQIIEIEDTEKKFSENRKFKNSIDSRMSFSEQRMRMIEKYGCQNFAEKVAVFTLDGERYYFFMQQACYDGKWYNLNPESIVAQIVSIGINSSGGIILENHVD